MFKSFRSESLKELRELHAEAEQLLADSEGVTAFNEELVQRYDNFWKRMRAYEQKALAHKMNAPVRAHRWNIFFLLVVHDVCSLLLSCG